MSGRASARRRIAAILALVGYAAALVALLVALRDDVLALVGAWVAAIVAAGAAFATLIQRGARRVLATVVAVVAAVSVVLILLGADAVLEILLFVALVVLAALTARYALGADATALRDLPPPGEPVTAPPRHAVLLMNPKSGGGKVEKFDLEHEADRRGIEPVVLAPGDDLEQLARDAVARGADVLGMAGGDGSQALVASIAIEHDLPFVCVPAGTRNHLALDLGVDRDDVVGSLEAFAHGYERRVDVGRVAGRVFVNNVSLGVYARIVQSDAYRDNKLGTVTDMLPALLGPDAPPFDLAFDDPNGPVEGEADLMLVSNNRYRLDRLGGLGSRPRMDTGMLGIVVVKVRSAPELAELIACQSAGKISRFRGWREWEAAALEVRSGDAIEAGVDGEALRFDSPLRFEIVPGALRVRVAPHHPGYSPAAVAETVQRGGIRRLVRVAAGRQAGLPRGPAGE